MFLNMVKLRISPCFYMYIQEREITMSTHISNIDNNFKQYPAAAENKTTVAAQPDKVFNVSMGNTDIYSKLGLTDAQIAAILEVYPNFLELKFEEQQEIVKSLKTNTAQQNVSETEVVTDEDISNISRDAAVKIAYNDKDFTGKLKDCTAELTRNLYIYGIKDFKGNTVFEGHSEAEWDNLSSDEKQAQINKCVSLLGKDEKFKTLINDIKSLPEENNDLKIMLLDSFMREIQTANLNNISLTEFRAKDEVTRSNMLYDYVFCCKNENTSNSSDDKFFNQCEALTTGVREALIKMGVKDVHEYFCIDDAVKYMDRYLLDADTIFHEQHSENNTAEMNETELKIHHYLSEKSRIQMALKSEERVAELEHKAQNGGLSVEEEVELSQRKEGLSLNKDLLEKRDHIKEPSNDYEKSVYNDYLAVKEQATKVSDSKLYIYSQMKFIDEKCANMSAKEKLNYIKTYLSFNNDSSSVVIFERFRKEFPQLLRDIRISDKAAANMTNMNGDEASIVAETIYDGYNNGYENEAKIAADIGITCMSADNRQSMDEPKGKLVDVAVKIGDENILMNATNMTTTIHDAKTQLGAENKILNSEGATPEVIIHAASQLSNFHKDNQVPLAKTVTDKSPEATAYMAEHNVISKCHKDNQTEIFSITHNAVNKHFEGADAVKYSNALIDQIQYCHKDNQLAMHNEIYNNTKYQEVREYAAQNISKLDTTVQGQAIDTVLRSGDKNAIEKVCGVIEKCSPDLQREQVQIIAVMNSLENKQNTFEDDIALKLSNSVALTPDELAKLSPAEKRSYYQKMFLNASASDKMTILRKLQGSQQKTVYTIICRYMPSLMENMIDEGMGPQMIKSGIPLELQSKVMNYMKNSTIGKVIEQYKTLEKSSNFRYFANQSDKKSASEGLKYMTDTFGNKKDKKIKDKVDIRI